LARYLLGHLRCGERRAQELVFKQPVDQIAAEYRVGQAPLAQRGEIGLLIELAAQRLERLDLQDLAVDEIVAGPETIFLRIEADGVAIDQLAHHLVECASRDEFGHGQGRVLLPHLIERRVGRSHQLGAGNRLAADHRHPVAARDAAESRRPGDIGRREGQRHQHQKAEEDRQADFRLEEAAEEGEHCGRDPERKTGKKQGP
jgi:hypothetical protein